MDDGQRVNRGGVTLCSDSFSTEEIIILKDALSNNFNLETTSPPYGEKNKKWFCDGRSLVLERIYIKKDHTQLRRGII